MADDGLVGEDNGGDGGVERGGNGAGDAASKEGDSVGAVEFKGLGEAGAEGCPEVNGGAVATDGGAESDGGNANNEINL